MKNKFIKIGKNEYVIAKGTYRIIATKGKTKDGITPYKIKLLELKPKGKNKIHKLKLLHKNKKHSIEFRKYRSKRDIRYESWYS